MARNPEVQDKELYVVNYDDFVKELSYRTGNTEADVRSFMKIVTDTTQDFLSYVDDNTDVIVRPMRGIRLYAQKKLESQYYHPVTREPFERTYKVSIKSKLENPLRTFDIEKHKREFTGE